MHTTEPDSTQGALQSAQHDLSVVKHLLLVTPQHFYSEVEVQVPSAHGQQTITVSSLNSAEWLSPCHAILQVLPGTELPKLHIPCVHIDGRTAALRDINASAVHSSGHFRATFHHSR